MYFLYRELIPKASLGYTCVCVEYYIYYTNITINQEERQQLRQSRYLPQVTI